MKKTEEKTPTTTSKIVILGGRNVGKSALAVRFLTKRFIGDYRSDTDMLYKCSAKIDGTAQSVEILDTSSDSDDVTEGHLLWADAFILVYSITDKESFSWVSHMMEILASVRPATPTLVVGAKSDLQHLKEVQELDGRCLALNHGSRFQELSSAEGYNTIVDTFESFLKEVRYFLHNTRSCGDIPPKRVKSSKFPFGPTKSTGELWPPKQKKNSLGRILGALIGKGSSSQAPITQLIVLDRNNEFCKSKVPIRHL